MTCSCLLQENATCHLRKTGQPKQTPARKTNEQFMKSDAEPDYNFAILVGANAFWKIEVVSRLATVWNKRNTWNVSTKSPKNQAAQAGCHHDWTELPSCRRIVSSVVFLPLSFATRGPAILVDCTCHLPPSSAVFFIQPLLKQMAKTWSSSACSVCLFTCVKNTASPKTKRTTLWNISPKSKEKD